MTVKFFLSDSGDDALSGLSPGVILSVTRERVRGGANVRLGQALPPLPSQDGVRTRADLGSNAFTRPQLMVQIVGGTKGLTIDHDLGQARCSASRSISQILDASFNDSSRVEGVS